MEPLKCDLCGGKLVMQPGGVAICENCGMEYSSALLKEKILEVKGTVKIDKSSDIDNYCVLGKNALECGDIDEVTKIAEKILAIDATNSYGWAFKYWSCYDDEDDDLSVSFLNKALKYSSPESLQDVEDLISHIICYNIKSFEKRDAHDTMFFIRELLDTALYNAKNINIDDAKKQEIICNCYDSAIKAILRHKDMEYFSKLLLRLFDIVEHCDKSVYESNKENIQTYVKEYLKNVDSNDNYWRPFAWDKINDLYDFSRIKIEHYKGEIHKSICNFCSDFEDEYKEILKNLLFNYYSEEMNIIVELIKEAMNKCFVRLIKENKEKINEFVEIVTNYYKSCKESLGIVDDRKLAVIDLNNIKGHSIEEYVASIYTKDCLWGKEEVVGLLEGSYDDIDGNIFDDTEEDIEENIVEDSEDLSFEDLCDVSNILSASVKEINDRMYQIGVYTSQITSEQLKLKDSNYDLGLFNFEKKKKIKERVKEIEYEIFVLDNVEKYISEGLEINKLNSQVEGYQAQKQELEAQLAECPFTAFSKKSDIKGQISQINSFIKDRESSLKEHQKNFDRSVKNLSK